MRKTFFRSADLIITVLILFIIIISIFFTGKHKDSSPELHIKTSDATYIYPLSKDNILQIKGNSGYSIIVIEDGKAFFQDSPCPNKNCVSAGKLKNPGDWAACLPNGIFISVEGSQVLDAISK